jgi:adenosine kinase
MEIVITGSIAYDYLMRFPGHFTEYFLEKDLHQISLSFLVDEMTKHWGGVGANISYTMALLGLRPRLMGTVGRDFGDYGQWLHRAGVDVSAVRRHDDVFTASFFATTDHDNNQIATFYAGAMAYSDGYRLSEAFTFKPDLVLISPSAPNAMAQLTQECRDRGIRFIYDPSQQVPRLDGRELREQMEGAYAMIVNAYEAEIIARKTGQTLEKLQHQFTYLVITQGKRGSHIYCDGDLLQVPTFPEVKIKDPTGVGDAYRAGLIRGLIAGWPLRLCGLVGALCATYVLEQVGTQNHHFTLPDFVERFRTEFDDEGLLDQLLHTASQA